MTPRLETKKAMWGAKFGRCDVCGKPASDMHEIFNRDITAKGSEAREISYSKELCSLLCRSCHERAGANSWAVGLLQLNYHYYGISTVLERYTALQAQMSTPLWNLPEYEPDVLKIKWELLRGRS